VYTSDGSSWAVPLLDCVPSGAAAVLISQTWVMSDLMERKKLWEKKGGRELAKEK